MVTSRLRTLAFVISSVFLAVGLGILLRRIQMPPPESLNDLVGYAQRLMTDTGRALFWVLLGGFCALLVVLWNSTALNRDWLSVVAYAFKGFGALLVLLLLILFLRQQQLNRAIETARGRQAEKEREGEEASRSKQRRLEQQRERNREGVATLLHRLAEHKDNPVARKITITVAGSQLRDDQLMSLDLAQALHATALYDPDDSVKDCARDMLYPVAPGTMVDWRTAHHTEFAQAVVRLLERYPELFKRDPYERYASLLSEECKADRELTGRLKSIASQASADVLAAAETSSALGNDSSVAVTHSPAPGSALPTAAPPATAIQPPAPAPPVLTSEETDRGVIMAAAHATASSQEKALDLLESASQTRVEKTIESLPPEAKPGLPPRVYVHVAEADELDRPKLKQVRDELRHLPLRTGKPTIVPKTIHVAEIRADAPRKTQVRYYAGEDSRGMAELLAKELARIGIKDIQIYQAKASPRELAEAQDQPGHLEIWFARKALD